MGMAPLSMILNWETKGYKFGNAGKLVNHLLFMDDLKLYASSQQELDSLVRTVESYIKGINFSVHKFSRVLIFAGTNFREWANCRFRGDQFSRTFANRPVLNISRVLIFANLWSKRSFLFSLWVIFFKRLHIYFSQFSFRRLSWNYCSSAYTNAQNSTASGKLILAGGTVPSPLTPAWSFLYVTPLRIKVVVKSQNRFSFFT